LILSQNGKTSHGAESSTSTSELGSFLQILKLHMTAQSESKVRFFKERLQIGASKLASQVLLQDELLAESPLQSADLALEKRFEETSIRDLSTRCSGALERLQRLQHLVVELGFPDYPQETLQQEQILFEDRLIPQE